MALNVLTDGGFLRPTYDELLGNRIETAKKLFGDDIDTSEQSYLGKHIRMSVYDLAKAYEILETVYYARFPNTAGGQNLDRLVPFAGITRNPPTYAIHEVEFTGAAGTTVPVGFLVGTMENRLFATSAAVELDEEGKGGVNVDATDPGLLGNVPLGAIEKIINPAIGIESVRHKNIVRIADDTETDYELRNRFNITVAGAGSANAQAIRSNIMRVPNVDGVIITENATDGTDGAGRPPHSFECYVSAPETHDYLVAQAIFDKKPIGIKSWGAVVVPVMDKGGFVHEIKFSRTAPINLSIKVSVKVSNTFESTGVGQIKTNLITFINTLGNGVDVVLSALYGKIHSVTGVMETTSLLLSTDGETYQAMNIPVAPAEVARADADRIVVEVISGGN